MTRSGLEGLLAPLMDLLMLGRRAIVLRYALMKADLHLRVSSLAKAVVLVVLAMVLVVIVIVLLIQAGLIGLALLGLTPLQALLTAAGVCALLVLIFLLIARSCLRRATLPFTPLVGTGETFPATRP